MGIYAELKVRGQILVVADPSGDTCNVAGDFDRLLPVPNTPFPSLLVEPYRDVVISGTYLMALAAEVSQLLKRTDTGPEHRGLLRLRAPSCGRARRAGF
jgi:hypothetical protein